MQAVSAPPAGPVTICFADVEDSTPIQTRYPELWVSLLASYRRIVRDPAQPARWTVGEELCVGVL